jgi:alkylation response protein AidB-like acyl-CoA dehydrogenase
MSTTQESLRPEELADAARAAVADARQRPFGDAARVLAEAGLTGVCAREEDGGLGLPLAFAVPIVQVAGELDLHFPLPEQLLLARHLAGTHWAEALASGGQAATIAWQGALESGWAGHARHASACQWVLVPENTADGLGAALLEVASLTVEEDACLDPEQAQQWLQCGSARVLTRLAPPAYAALLHEARLLMAALAHGAATGALQATFTHVSTRVQFGRPLSAKQAVRHWLSRMKLVLDVSGAAIDRVLATDEYGQPRSSVTTLAGALSNSAFVIEKAIHLHGGMGFTWEVPLHHALREVRKLDAAFGAGALASAAGRSFIESA